jgi:hypothetical protein
MADEKQADQQGDPAKQPAGQTPSRKRVFFDPSTWTVLLLIAFGFALLFAILTNKPAIDRLADPAYARGVITWMISLATIGIAFVLIYQAFFSVESSDDRFRRAREIFTGLMGVLGTIVGFYFGSTEPAAGRLRLAVGQVLDRRVLTFVSGGEAPYRYTLTYKNAVPAAKVSQDGWIIDTLPAAPEAGSKITITVTDSKKQEATADIIVPGTPPTQTPPTGAAAVDTGKSH